MKICGPKFALCGLVISAWGIIQLFLMGVFFFMRSVALIEDIDIPEDLNSTNLFYFHVREGYRKNAINCWIAACIYIITLVFSGHQFYMNSKSSLNV